MVVDTPIDHGDVKAVRKNRKKLALWREREIEDTRRLLVDKRFRDFCWRLLERANIYNFGFVSDPNLLYYKRGQQAQAGFLLEELLTANANSYMMMRAEHAEVAATGNDTMREEQEEDNG